MTIGSKLKAYCAQNRLYYVSNVSGDKITIKGDRHNAPRLDHLVEVKSQQIAAQKAHVAERKLNILVAESHPLEFLAVFLAAIANETNLFLANPHWQQQEWQQVWQLVNPDLIFADSSVKNLITPDPNLKKITGIADPLPEQSLIMIPTGGSSGKIKFAMHTWWSLQASVAGFQAYFNCEEINSFCTLPLYHVSGLMQFMRSFLTQGKLIICPYQFLKTKTIDWQPEDFFISLVPTQLQLLMALMPNWLGQFKTILLGGAPATNSLLNLARQYQLPLAPTYGMTETASQIVTLTPQDFLKGNNSSGRVLPHAQISLISETESDRPIGLIQVRSNSLCWGYYPQPFQEKESLVTDDLGYFDDAGYLYLVGRNSQTIITGGEKVFPGEVEAAIMATQLVADVCVVGVKDAYWGEMVTAIYVTLGDRPLLNPRQIQLPLAKYKQPKHWLQVNSLERNDRGKVDYSYLKAIAESLLV